MIVVRPLNDKLIAPLLLLDDHDNQGDDENHEEEGLVTIEGDALEEFHLQSMIIMS